MDTGTDAAALFCPPLAGACSCVRRAVNEKMHSAVGLGIMEEHGLFQLLDEEPTGEVM